MQKPELTYIISDLHLSEKSPKTLSTFKAFVNDKAMASQSLYILGDFFEFWIGDDDLSPFHTEIINILKNLSNSGTEVFFMHGNRDFLVGKKLADAAGARLIDDPTLKRIYNHKILFTHGDLLCTDDLAYLRYRKIIRSRFIILLSKILPLSLRRKIALNLRKQSRGNQSQNTDVNQAAVEETLQKHNCQIMIHGHTHIFATHQHKNGTRYVLSDWHDDNGSYISIDSTSIKLEKYTIAKAS